MLETVAGYEIPARRVGGHAPLPTEAATHWVEGRAQEKEPAGQAGSTENKRKARRLSPS